jgi:hypothetical protein
MKFLVPAAGVLGVLSVFFGILFKVLHLAGADELLMIGPLWLILIFIPLVLVQRYRRKSNS